MNGPKKPANAFIRGCRTIASVFGFTRTYNLVLWFIFGGALFGFVLARFQYLNFDGVYCNSESSGSQSGNSAAPGECYWYENFSRYKVGIVMHLACILIAGVLAIFQFIPIVRHKAILYHRIAGYVIIILVMFSNASAVMIVDKAFGGTASTQCFVGFVAVATTIGIWLAYYNIKRLQIDQHRAWMLRVWFYMGSIITERIIMILAVLVISSWPSEMQYKSMPCKVVEYIIRSTRPDDVASEYLDRNYPACNSSNSNFTVDGHVVVKGDFGAGSAENISAAMQSVFDMSLWLAFAIHAIGVEIYLKLTPREAVRLREVSYKRQLEAGFKNPGSAGLVIEKFGDAEPWKPMSEQQNEVDPEAMEGTVVKTKAAET